MVAVELTEEQIQSLINLLSSATVPMNLAESALKTLNTLKSSISDGEESTD